MVFLHKVRLRQCPVYILEATIKRVQEVREYSTRQVEDFFHGVHLRGVAHYCRGEQINTTLWAGIEK